MRICQNCNRPSKTVKDWSPELQLCEVCTQYYVEKCAHNHREKQGFHGKPMKQFPEWIQTYRKRLEKWLEDQESTIQELKRKIEELDAYQ